MTARKFMMPAASAPVGQIVFTSSQSWTVPAGVTKISVVVVGSQYGTISSLKRSAATLLASDTTLGGSVGGGDGGVPGSFSGPSWTYGGGGAGGYTGNGGNGYNAQTAAASTAGSGGGGGGGNSGYRGGGVGLNGTGTSGGRGSPGGNGSIPPGSTAYGAQTNAPTANMVPSSANLRYQNDIVVTPGETLTITVSNTNNTSAIRAMWGGGRSFPSNAGDL